MFWRKPSLSDRAQRRFIPQLEVMENRLCPAVTAGLQNGLLTITGDNNANEVRITETNTGFRVTGAGPTRTFQNVTGITVDLRGGNDTLFLNLSGASAQNLNVQVLGGAGDDKVNVALNNVRS